jgi:hypothetical protein
VSDDPYDLSVVLARDETPDSLAELVLAAVDASASWASILDVLTTRFALSFDDARLAWDRVLGGRTRAESGNSQDAPDQNDDPLAWASFQRTRGAPLDRVATNSAAWNALVTEISASDGAQAAATCDDPDFSSTLWPEEREAVIAWSAAFEARGKTRATTNPLVALRLACLADATMRTSSASMAKGNVLLQAVTAISCAAEAAIDARTGPAAQERTRQWADAVELAEASRRIADHFRALGKTELEERTMGLRGRIVTALLGRSRAWVGRVMLDSVRYARRRGDEQRAADLCAAVAADFESIVEIGEGTEEAPRDEDREALSHLRDALDLCIELDVADEDDRLLRDRCVALLART